MFTLPFTTSFTLPFTIYGLPAFCRDFSPESRLTEGGGALPLIDRKKYKNSLSKTAKKMMLI